MSESFFRPGDSPCDSDLWTGLLAEINRYCQAPPSTCIRRQRHKSHHVGTLCQWRDCLCGQLTLNIAVAAAEQMYQETSRGLLMFEHNSIHFYLLDLLCFYEATLNLPVELCVFHKRVHISIPNEHVTPHAGETLRVVLLVPGNLFDQGDSLMKPTATVAASKRGGLSLSWHACLEAFVVSGCARGYPVDWALENSVFVHTRREQRSRKALNVG